MGSIILIILDDDQAYLEMISGYVQASSYKVKIQIKTFTLRSALDSYLEASGKYDLLVVQSELFDSSLDAATKGSCIVLYGEIRHDLNSPDVIFLNKYQPLNLLLDRMLAIYANYYTKAFDLSSTAQIISVYSAVGGTGKTTVAANLAKLLSFLDKKVFYLNLEMLPSVSMFPIRENSQNFAQFLYYVQIQAEHLASKLESLKYYDPLTKVHFFEPLLNLVDMEEMTGNAVETLLHTLTTHGDYDYIIIDLDHSLHERIVRALALSQQIIWLVLDDLNNIHKSEAVLKEIKSRVSVLAPRWIEKVYYVLNKYTGKISNDMNSHSIRISGQLPYVPQWKSVHTVEQLMSENAFHGHLLQWFFTVNELNRI